MAVLTIFSLPLRLRQPILFWAKTFSATYMHSPEVQCGQRTAFHPKRASNLSEDACSGARQPVRWCQPYREIEVSVMRQQISRLSALFMVLLLLPVPDWA